MQRTVRDVPEAPLRRLADTQRLCAHNAGLWLVAEAPQRPTSAVRRPAAPAGVSPMLACTKHDHVVATGNSVVARSARSAPPP